MNLFVVDTNPRIAATMLCDKHVVKQTLETAQLLSTVQRLYGNSVRYRSTHIHHPCTRWCGRSRENYQWSWEHGISLCEEYTHRYGRVHKCQELFLGELRDTSYLPDRPLEDFVQCMPEQYRCDNTVMAYRDYYNHEKAYFAKWTNRPIPRWFKGEKKKEG